MSTLPFLLHQQQLKGKDLSFSFDNKSLTSILGFMVSNFPYSLETEPTYNPLTIKKNNCPEHGLITVEHLGRLGNLMCQYATLYAYSKLLNRKPVISSLHMSNDLLNLFPSAFIPNSSICKLKKLKHLLDDLMNNALGYLLPKSFHTLLLSP